MGIIIAVNMLFMSITDDAYNSLHVAMYVTIIGIHMVTITLVFAFQTPSIFTSLFLGYAITSISERYDSIEWDTILCWNIDCSTTS